MLSMDHQISRRHRISTMCQPHRQITGCHPSRMSSQNPLERPAATTTTAPAIRHIRIISPRSRPPAFLPSSPLTRLAHASTSLLKKPLHLSLEAVRIFCHALSIMVVTSPPLLPHQCQTRRHLPAIQSTPSSTVAVAAGGGAETNTSVIWVPRPWADKQPDLDRSAKVATPQKRSRRRRTSSLQYVHEPGTFSTREIISPYLDTSYRGIYD